MAICSIVTYSSIFKKNIAYIRILLISKVATVFACYNQALFPSFPQKAMFQQQFTDIL